MHVQQRHREAVRDHVVHLAGDTVALLGLRALAPDRPAPHAAARAGRAAVARTCSRRRQRPCRQSSANQPGSCTVKRNSPSKRRTVPTARTAVTSMGAASAAQPTSTITANQPTLDGTPLHTTATAATAPAAAGSIQVRDAKNAAAPRTSPARPNTRARMGRSPRAPDHSDNDQEREHAEDRPPRSARERLRHARQVSHKSMPTFTGPCAAPRHMWPRRRAQLPRSAPVSRYRYRARARESIW